MLLQMALFYSFLCSPEIFDGSQGYVNYTMATERTLTYLQRAEHL